MPDVAVVARDLTKHFGSLVAVDALNLSIPKGICFGLLGPNGAGKTTTIRMMQGQTPMTSGSLHILGLDAAREPRKIKSIMGVVPQENNLDPDFTVHKNLTVYGRFFGKSQVDSAAKADDLLNYMALNEKRDASVQELSGGMRRRLIVARALVNDPEILVLDEPTTGLDPQARHTIWNKIRQLRSQGKTILLTTHYMDEAEMLCDELVIIDHGKILERGNPRQLIVKHTQGEAVEFVVGYDESGAAVQRLCDNLKAQGVDFERLPDRAIAYGPKAVAAENANLEGVVERIRRRATLEDVFLRLTGRALRD